MPDDERRLNIRVNEETHYWLNLDAARYGRSLQGHVNALLSEHATKTKEQFGGVRPEGTKGGQSGTATRTPGGAAMAADGPTPAYDSSG